MRLQLLTEMKQTEKPKSNSGCGVNSKIWSTNQLPHCSQPTMLKKKKKLNWFLMISVKKSFLFLRLVWVGIGHSW